MNADERRLKFKQCPTCGSRKIKVIEGDYPTTRRGRPIVVLNVRRHECPACGEVLFDYEAMKQIEARRFSARKLRELARM
jgi:YgiT-type zinc finger domain-containing protein